MRQAGCFSVLHPPFSTICFLHEMGYTTERGKVAGTEGAENGEGRWKMEYEDWVRGELEELSKSLGFRYIPQEELADRLARLRKGMEKEGMEAFLVVQKMDYYYYRPNFKRAKVEPCRHFGARDC